MNNNDTQRERVSQSLVGGLVLIVIAALALWLTSDLSQGTLSSMGAGLLPRWLAIAIAICGIVLLGFGLRSKNEALESANWRGVALILIAILGFGAFIRPFSFGPISTPSLGLIIAGPFAVIVGGLASPEARLRELFIVAFVLTAFSIILFSDVLNLPIPIFPQFANPLLSGISPKLALRLAAAFLLLAGLLAAVPDYLALYRQGRQRVQLSEKDRD